MSDQLIFETGFFMSPNDIFDNERLDTKEKLVYLYLCRCSNNGSAAFPSYSTIGKKCSFSRRSAIEAVNGLVGKGIVKRVPRGDESGSKSNVYRITARGADSAPGADISPPSADIAPGVVQILHPPSAESAPYKELSIKNQSYKEPSKKDMSGSPDASLLINVIDHLNGKMGSRYRWQTDSTAKAIGARWKEGYKLEDFKTVIDKKVAEWKGTDMEQYLRPDTLFRPGKFESYLNQPWPPGKGPKGGASSEADQSGGSSSSLNRFVIE